MKAKEFVQTAMNIKALPPQYRRLHKTGRLGARGTYPVHLSTGSAFPKV